jgi:integrase
MENTRLLVLIVLKIIKRSNNIIRRLRESNETSIYRSIKNLERSIEGADRIRLKILEESLEFKALIFIESGVMNLIDRSTVTPVLNSLSSRTWSSYRSGVKSYLMWALENNVGQVFPVSSKAARSFASSATKNSRYLGALKKFHEILELEILFDDPLTHMVQKGMKNGATDKRNEKAFGSLELLRRICEEARKYGLLLIGDIACLAYWLRLRVPSELLAENNRAMRILGDFVYISLKKTKNYRNTIHKKAACTCKSGDPTICPVEAARRLLSRKSGTVTAGLFNRALAHLCKLSGVRRLTSHSFRRGFINDLAEKGIHRDRLMTLGPWKSVGTLKYYTSNAVQSTLKNRVKRD